MVKGNADGGHDVFICWIGRKEDAPTPKELDQHIKINY